MLQAALKSFNQTRFFLSHNFQEPTRILLALKPILNQLIDLDTESKQPAAAAALEANCFQFHSFVF